LSGTAACDSMGAAMSVVQDVFGYAFRGGGKYILLIGAALFVVSDLLMFAPVIGVLAQLFLFGYFCAIYFQVIESSATGGAEAPYFPETAHLADDIILPMFRVIAVWLVCFGPTLAYAVFGDPESPLLLVVLAAGVVYFPMAMLGVAVLGYFGALSPHIVLPAIFRAGGLYWLAVFVLLMLYLGLAFVEGTLASRPILSSLVTALLGMYVMMTNGRMLGLIYRERRDEMNWI